MTLEQKALLSVLVSRWIVELEDNLANLEVNMPGSLQGMMRVEIEKALILARETLGAIDES